MDAGIGDGMSNGFSDSAFENKVPGLQATLKPGSGADFAGEGTPSNPCDNDGHGNRCQQSHPI